jgi:hypothetical protein
MGRAVLGVIAGGIVWWVSFFFGFGLLLMLAWPAYAAAAKDFMQTGVYTLSPSMSGVNIAFWILAEMCAGWATAVVSRRLEAVWVLAALMMSGMGVMHLYLEWDRFPWWYNLAVVIPVVPATLFGARFARRSTQ